MTVFRSVGPVRGVVHWRHFAESVLVCEKMNIRRCAPFLPLNVVSFLGVSLGRAAAISLPQGEEPENTTDAKDSRVEGGRNWADGITEPLTVCMFPSMKFKPV